MAQQSEKIDQIKKTIVETLLDVANDTNVAAHDRITACHELLDILRGDGLTP